MDKLQIIKKIVYIILILSVVTLFISLVLTVVTRFTGCPYNTKITNIENPENINVKIFGGPCLERFRILNQEEETLWLYAIRGDIITWENNTKDTVNNTIICLSALYGDRNDWSRDALKIVDDPQSCASNGVGANQEYYIERVKGSWELYTDKGNIIGYTEYKPVRTNQNAFFIFKISGIVFIISLIVSIFLRKKK